MALIQNALKMLHSIFILMKWKIKIECFEVFIVHSGSHHMNKIKGARFLNLFTRDTYIQNLLLQTICKLIGYCMAF